MPMIDMPLEELKRYKGISPCPEDVDMFWDEAVEEMKNVHPKLLLDRRRFNAALRSVMFCILTVLATQGYTRNM